MSNAPTLDALVAVRPRFARSVALVRDAHRADARDGYVLTPAGRGVRRRQRRVSGARPRVGSLKGEEMSSATIAPVAQGLYLCDGHLGFPNGKTDLVGLFNSIHAASYPHVQKQFVVFARLHQGLGQVPFYVDIRFAPTQQLSHMSGRHVLYFPDRATVVEMALTLKDVRFPQPGIYLVELFCNAQWVADTTVLLQ
jgi:hypothetical protein